LLHSKLRARTLWKSSTPKRASLTIVGEKDACVRDHRLLRVDKDVAHSDRCLRPASFHPSNCTSNQLDCRLSTQSEALFELVLVDGLYLQLGKLLFNLDVAILAAAYTAAASRSRMNLPGEMMLPGKGDPVCTPLISVLLAGSYSVLAGSREEK